MSVEYAREGGTWSKPVSFTDEARDAVVPDSITWTLSKINGDIVNSREDVDVVPPASSINITLSGDDLAVADDEDVVRVLTVKMVYDSSIGNDLPQNDKTTFNIIPLSQIP